MDMQRITTSAVIVTVIVVGLHLFVKSVSCVAKVVVQPDISLSKEIAGHMSHLVKKFSHESPGLLFKRLHEEFPCVRSLQCRYNSRHELVVSIAVAIPLFILNNHLLLSDNTIVPKEWYDSLSLKNIPTIRVSDFDWQKNKDIPVPLLGFIKQIPGDLFTKFDCHWGNEFEIFLRDKQQESCALMVSNNTHLESAIRAYEVIVNQLREYQESRGGKKDKRWIVDARFEHQLILHRYRGGEWYG